MKLLIVTQKVDKDDSYFGFFHGWLLEFAKQCDAVTVIGLEVGEYDLPKNVRVYSLGKESGKSKITYVYRLWKYSWRERKNYDSVFAHMSPLFVIYGSLLWKSLGKKISLWYVHRNVDFKLRVATIFADVIFSATPESFRIKSPKVHFMGQAVPVDFYKRSENFPAKNTSIFSIVSVGRITPIKNLETLIEAANILRDKNFNCHINLVGAPVVSSDFEYKEKLAALIKKYNVGDTVTFIGSVPNKEIASYYWKNDLSINLCPTGGLDKAVLESMAAGTPVMASNQAFKGHFGPYVDMLLFRQNDASDLAQKIVQFSNSPQKEAIRVFLQKKIEESSSLKNLIARIIEIYGKQ